ncbi:MAG: hypothetical protein LAT62_14885 [Natronospirillum sp.]|uniref:hypothetical protein n=1 Tax=Natronospirillum sp. TaxID=2812955 RepID=UPI0025DE232D|nr:hypothetical protein [Natronospirillum sp.]MCH8553221.1 hypothetical protein [Natronospirillum sp.]
MNNYQVESLAQQVAQVLCDATMQVMYPRYKDKLLEAFPGYRMEVAVGRGRATNHKLRKDNRLQKITYGRDMVLSKFSSRQRHAWTTSKEIRRRGYFRGEVSFMTLMVAVVLHEFAHAVQHAEGGRQRGSVHNAHFYRILDAMHRSDLPEQVRTYLAERIPMDRVAIAEQADIETMVASKQQSRDRAASRRLPAGTPLDGLHAGSKIMVKGRPDMGYYRVTRINKQTVSADSLEGRRGVRIPWDLVEMCGEDEGPATPPEQSDRLSVGDLFTIHGRPELGEYRVVRINRQSVRGESLNGGRDCRASHSMVVKSQSQQAA